VNTDVDAMSPRARARITGILYLGYFLTALADEIFIGRSRPVVYDALDLLAYTFYVAVTLRFYYLFKPVNARVSLLAACFSIAGCSNDVLGLFNLAPFEISSLIFFGPYCLLVGYLIFRSTFLPRMLGVLMMLAGAGWLIFLLPVAGAWTTFMQMLGFTAELSLMLRLIVKGINGQRWNELVTGYSNCQRQSGVLR